MTNGVRPDAGLLSDLAVALMAKSMGELRQETAVENAAILRRTADRYCEGAAELEQAGFFLSARGLRAAAAVAFRRAQQLDCRQRPARTGAPAPFLTLVVSNAS